MNNISRLYCSKVSLNPHKEELITEITEKVFQVDGYEVAERLLEGIKFDVYFDNNKVTKVEIGDAHDKSYFEKTYNTNTWYTAVIEYAQRIINTGDEVEVPKFIKDKYYKNGINISFITKDDLAQ